MCDSLSGERASVDKSADSSCGYLLKDLNLLHELEVGYSNEERRKTDSNPGI